MIRFALLLLLATACSPAPSQHPEAPSAPELLGTWRIVALDGRAASAGRGGEPPVLSFSAQGYGGNAGCNGFGGLGFAHEGRFYGGFAVSTAMACGPPYDEQERAVQQMLGSGPRVEWRSADRMALVGSGRMIELQRTASVIGQEAAAPPMPLLGTTWSFGALGGRPLDMPGARSGPTLTLEGERFTFATPCVTTEGTWRQTTPVTVTLAPDRRTPRSCNPASRRQSEAWADALQGRLRYAVGPNGEILLAGSGRWTFGDLLRRGSSEALTGRYVVEGSPTQPRSGERRVPELILTRSAFYLWDGCNHSEGVAIAFERQLFLHGSGVTTLASCMAGQVHDRLKSVVLSEPRIGRIPDGLLLSSPAGTVRLRRTGDALPGGGVTTRLAPGMRFTLLTEPGATLAILPGNRFRLTQPCGTTVGRWRAAPGERDGALRFGPDRPAEPCERNPAARALQNVFLGHVDVAIGPNRDIALFAGRFGAVRARLER